MKPGIRIILQTLRGLRYCYYTCKVQILCDQLSVNMAAARPVFETRDSVWPPDYVSVSSSSELVTHL